MEDILYAISCLLGGLCLTIFSSHIEKFHHRPPHARNPSSNKNPLRSGNNCLLLFMD
jgi:hypothetical protein